MGVNRIRRISEEIKKIVSDIIRNDIKDPRVSKLTTVTHVETTNDLRFTNIYVSVYDPKADPVKTVEGLNSAKGFIRRAIGAGIDLRYTPEPLFKLDKSIENGIYINTLLSTLNIPKDEDDEGDEFQDEEDFEGLDTEDEDE